MKYFLSDEGKQLLLESTSNLTQAEVARELGFTPVHVSRVFGGAVMGPRFRAAVRDLLGDDAFFEEAVEVGAEEEPETEENIFAIP